MQVAKISQIQSNDFTRAIRYLFKNYVKDAEVPEPICQLIFHQYRNLTLEDLERVFKKGAAGEYEKIWQPSEITQWIAKYSESLSSIPQRRTISMNDFSPQDEQNIKNRGFAYESEILRYRITFKVEFKEAALKLAAMTK